ncbi:hypothetical protein F7725_020737 [Dissostichus mawsoni]|uniref:Interferon-induced very large GTPase 1-like n=1 Tax=Dissostichus mawsoni TaxID=36200 RepID=A0A7J5YG12_DISMA|nr:hypothetical protein F7725_020737 [Dissostichus mawsoni]
MEDSFPEDSQMAWLRLDGIYLLVTLSEIFFLSLWSSLTSVVMPVNMKNASAFYVKRLQPWWFSVGIFGRKKNKFLHLANSENNDNRVVGFAGQNLEEYMELPGGSVVQGRDLSEEELANMLCGSLKDLLPDELKLVTLQAAAKLAEKLGLNVDEGAVCKKAMATVEKVLEGLDEGSAEFRDKQLPLQGSLWSKLAEMEKEESKQRKEGKEIDEQLQKEKKDILVELSCYKMTSAMKMFTGALSATDKVERTYFLSWMKLRLRLNQMKKQNSPQDLFTKLKTEKKDGLPEHCDNILNGVNYDTGESDSFCTDSTPEEDNTEEQLMNHELQDSEQQWEHSCLEHMESWLKGATETIFDTKAKALDAEIQNSLLSKLKDEAREEVKTEVDKLRSKADAYLMKDNVLEMNTFKPILMSNMDHLQEEVTEEMVQRLGTVNESHCSLAQLERFENSLEKEQESKLHALVENSKSSKVLLQDTELEEEFEDKHMKKLEVIGKNQASGFQVNDEHFGYRSRLKHMFEDNNRLQRIEAQQVACNVMEEYNQFVADKSSLAADFSDSYIAELLENVEKALKEKSMEIRSAFEVDLKVYLCSAACQDFQKLHDRYAKDSVLLTTITATKSKYMSDFIYKFRKRDQCQRVAQAFTSMVVKPTVITTEWDRFVTCLMELLAAMRLELAQEFSQNVEITQLLQCPIIQPQEALFERVRGCDQHCPLCKAPCELQEGHELHKALLHRPKDMLPHDSGMTEGNPGMSKDKQDLSVACSSLHSLYPDWSISHGDPNTEMPCAYWRYVWARFNESFAKEYNQEPADISDEWKEITEEEALDSLKEAFFHGQC